MSEIKIFTVGHSTHDISYFVELLKTFSIDTLIDVRSVAASAYSPQYNKESLSAFLLRHKISYLHFADEFGARKTDASLLDKEGKVDFEKVRNSNPFKSGVHQLKKMSGENKIMALMCSEANPFDCHRFSMVSVQLAKENFEVVHILKDKSVVTNKELEEELLKKYAKKIPQPSLFEPEISTEQQLNFAYRLRNRDVAYNTVAEPLQ
ncbi:MAG: DUF488 domain-containing protein [Bacteroidota bacterium]